MAEMADSERTIWALAGQVRSLVERLAEVEAERDLMTRETRRLAHRLAEVEAERDSARRTAETYLDKLAELDTALAAVDDVLFNVPAPSWLDEIAARGEGDRGA